jgi:hypothetical protein
MESRKNRLAALLIDLCHLADAWGIDLTALACEAYVEYNSATYIPGDKAKFIPPVTTIPERKTVFVTDADALMIDQLHNHRANVGTYIPKKNEHTSDELAGGDIGRGLTTPIIYFPDVPASEMVDLGAGTISSDKLLEACVKGAGFDIDLKELEGGITVDDQDLARILVYTQKQPEIQNEPKTFERGQTPFIQPIDSPGFAVGEFVKDPHFAEERPGIVIFKHGLTDVTSEDLVDKDGASKCVGYVEPKTEE